MRVISARVDVARMKTERTRCTSTVRVVRKLLKGDFSTKKKKQIGLLNLLRPDDLSIWPCNCATRLRPVRCPKLFRKERFLAIHAVRLPLGVWWQRRSGWHCRTVLSVAWFRQVLLVVIFGEKKLWRRVDDLGRNHFTASTVVVLERCLVGYLACLCQLLLLRVVTINSRSVLRAAVVALPHALRWVVRRPKQSQQVYKGHLLWVVHHLHHFVVSSLARAHLFVAWVLCMPANISNGSRVNSWKPPKAFLCTPEASRSEYSYLKAFFKGSLDWITCDKVHVGHRYFALRARQTLACRRNGRSFVTHQKR